MMHPGSFEKQLYGLPHKGKAAIDRRWMFNVELSEKCAIFCEEL
jgi:hypothetical protein